MKVWRCTSCGNLVMKSDRPKKCLNCRTGERPTAEGWDLYPRERLYEEVDL